MVPFCSSPWEQEPVCAIPGFHREGLVLGPFSLAICSLPRAITVALHPQLLSQGSDSLVPISDLFHFNEGLSQVDRGKMELV